MTLFPEQYSTPVELVIDNIRFEKVCVPTNVDAESHAPYLGYR